MTEEQLPSNPPAADEDSKSDCSERRTSVSSSGDENASLKSGGNKGRKSSIYEQKQIEAPITSKGNRIASRTENLFKQYERDVGAIAPDEEKSKVDIAREQKQKELEEMKKLYQQRLEDDEKSQQEERIRQRENAELKRRKELGENFN